MEATRARFSAGLSSETWHQILNEIGAGKFLEM
jgi:hypothetical protein